MSKAIVPDHNMPVMPLQRRTHNSGSYIPSGPSSPTTPDATHVHPLRSHAPDSRYSQYREPLSPASQSPRPDSDTLRKGRGSIYGSGGDGSYEILEDYEIPMPPLPSPTHPSLRNSVSSTTRFSDTPIPVISNHIPIVAARAIRPTLRSTLSYGDTPTSVVNNGIPIVAARAVRPPLRPTLSYGSTPTPSGTKIRPPFRPTISFGGESRKSYHSLVTPSGSRPQTATVQEQMLQRQQRIEVSESPGSKVLAAFGITCLRP